MNYPLLSSVTANFYLHPQSFSTYSANSYHKYCTAIRIKLYRESATSLH